MNETTAVTDKQIVGEIVQRVIDSVNTITISTSLESIVIGFLLTIVGGVLIGYIFHIFENINKKNEANKVYKALLKRLERMKQIIEPYKDGEQYVLPDNISQEIQTLNAGQIVVEAYWHLVRTEGMFYSIFNAQLHLLSLEIIDKVDNLHDSIDTRDLFIRMMQSSAKMYEVTKVYQLVTELTEDITKLKI